MQTSSIRKRITIIVLFVVSAVCALLFPVEIRSTAKFSRTHELDGSFVACCLRLDDPRVQNALLCSPGFNITAIPEKFSSGSDLFSRSMPRLSLENGLKTSRSISIEGETEIGPILLELHQDKTLNLQYLEVDTYSTKASGRIEYYGHRLRAMPKNERQTDIVVNVEIRVRLFLPWTLRDYVQSNLNRSVEQHGNDFVEQLIRSVHRNN